MRRCRGLVPWSLLSAASLAGCAPTLAGQLKGPDGQVVTGPDARVNIVSLAGGDGEAVVQSVEVDKAGEFATSEALQPGDYLVEALVPGYALASKTVRVGETRLVELTLTPVASVKAATTRANGGLDAARGGGDAMLTPPSL